MPPHGSAYSLIKSALVFALEARPGLAGVAVSYDAPVRPLEVTGPTGAHEAIWCDRAEGPLDSVVFTAGDLIFDENLTLDLVIQVLHKNSGTQQAADERAAELVYEVLAEIARQKEWDFADLDLSQFEYLYFLPVSQAWVPGFLEGTTGGHGASCRLGIQVRARRSFT